MKLLEWKILAAMVLMRFVKRHHQDRKPMAQRGGVE